MQPKEEIKSSFVVVSQRIAKLDGERLIFPTKHPKKAQIRLIPKNSLQKSLLEQAQNGYWKFGQIFLTPKWCTIPFTRFLDLSKEEQDPHIQTLLKTV